MKITTDKGEVMHIHIGHPLSGYRLVKVELSHDEFFDPDLFGYLKTTIYCRMAPANGQK